MIFIVYCKDRTDRPDLRAKLIDAHRAYLATHSHPVETLLSGPLTTDDGARMTGSFFLLNAENRAHIEAWMADDPLKTSGLWDMIAIEPFHKRVDNLSVSHASARGAGT